MKFKSRTNKAMLLEIRLKVSPWEGVVTRWGGGRDTEELVTSPPSPGHRIHECVWFMKTHQALHL